MLATCINIAAEPAKNTVKAKLSNLEGEVGLEQSALIPTTRPAGGDLGAVLGKGEKSQL